ncbi:hypothetical protein BS329_35405 [Amycolatopsis coloradensis]|uniref:Uncharacterized protein n=1 Tax=Amycolatopsis coloradensis TaxID=76021 RepID=A0A1R0KHB7_9PSEU|nr:IniB N-terminal domain-containing protein [Amycolatopsis coloradensis]OLZ45038.1 hypothetical protein BS329_35405 [Amycolatopsis coloradensis]
MNPTQSLYDFTLNLLNDPSARESFGNNPQQMLTDAGLGDISGADLHDVLPLVLDYAPVNSLGGQNGLDLDSITSGQAGAIEQLQALTQNLALGDNTTENNVLGAVGGMTAITQNAAAPFTTAGDLAGDIDNVGGGEIAPVGAVTGAVGDVAGGDVTGALDGGDLTAGLQDVSGLNSAIEGTQGVGSTVGDLTGTLGLDTGLGNTIGGVTTHGVGDVAGNVTTHLNDIANESAVGNVTNHIGDVTSHVGDIGSHAASVNDVHDVVSNIGNGALGGGIAADLSHLTIGSGNDVHVSE